MATFVISHSDELANLKVVLVQRFILEWQFLLWNCSFLDSPVLWIGMSSTFNSTPEAYWPNYDITIVWYFKEWSYFCRIRLWFIILKFVIIICTKKLNSHKYRNLHPCLAHIPLTNSHPSANVRQINSPATAIPSNNRHVWSRDSWDIYFAHFRVFKMMHKQCFIRTST